MTAPKSFNGGRGEGWVAFQLALFAAIMFAPTVSQIADNGSLAGLRMVGYGLLIAGLALVIVSSAFLGNSLTVFPRPKDDGSLKQHGVYALVRHPIYSGVILAALGGSLSALSPLGLALTAVLVVFFDRKSRREERWLVEKYPDYPAYRQRVKRLIPWIY